MNKKLLSRMLVMLACSFAWLVLKSECYFNYQVHCKIMNTEKQDTAGSVPGLPFEAAFFVRI